MKLDYFKNNIFVVVILFVLSCSGGGSNSSSNDVNNNNSGDDEEDRAAPDLGGIDAPVNEAEAPAADSINLCGNLIVDVPETCDEDSVFCSACQPDLYEIRSAQEVGADRVGGFSISPRGDYAIVGLSGNNRAASLYYHPLSPKGEVRNIGQYNLVALNTSPVTYNDSGSIAYFSAQVGESIKIFSFNALNPDQQPQEINLATPENMMPLSIVYADGRQFYYLAMLRDNNRDESIPYLLHYNRLTRRTQIVADNVDYELKIPVVIRDVVYLVRFEEVNNEFYPHLFRASIGANGFELTKLTGSIEAPKRIANWSVAPNNNFAVVAVETDASSYKYSIHKINFLNNNALQLLLTFKRTAGLDANTLVVHPDSRHLLFNTRDGQNGAGPHNLYSLLLDAQAPPALLTGVTANPAQPYKYNSGNLFLQIDALGDIYFLADRVDESPQPTYELLKAQPSGASVAVYSDFLPAEASINAFIVSGTPSEVGVLWRPLNDGLGLPAITIKKNN